MNAKTDSKTSLFPKAKLRTLTKLNTDGVERVFTELTGLQATTLSIVTGIATASSVKDLVERSQVYHDYQLFYICLSLEAGMAGVEWQAIADDLKDTPGTFQDELYDSVLEVNGKKTAAAPEQQA